MSKGSGLAFEIVTVWAELGLPICVAGNVMLVLLTLAWLCATVTVPLWLTELPDASCAE